MAKVTPASGDPNLRFDDRRKLPEFLAELDKQVAHASESRSDWMRRKTHFYERRYGRLGRNVQYPWPGASDVILPLIDTHVEELKPPLVNMHLGNSRVYSMQPMNTAAIQNVAYSNQAMESLIRYRMKDYERQALLGIDCLATYGIKTDKVRYAYVTRQTFDTLRKIELPPALRTMAVFDEVTPQEKMFAEQAGATLLTKEEFDAQAQAIEAVLIEWVGLDTDEKVDRVALGEIMSWLRNGSRDAEITIKRRAVIEDAPRLECVPQENLIVPAGTDDIANAPFIAHRLFWTENEIRQRGRDETWNKDVVDAMLASDPGRSGPDDDQIMADAKRDRFNTSGADLWSDNADARWEVREICCEYDLDGDGLAERVVITVPASHPDKALKAIPLPFDHGEWPYTDTFLEATDNDRMAPRGIPEILDDPERHATSLMRHEENALLIQTCPTFGYVEGAGFNPNTVTWIPGMFLPMAAPGEIAPLNIPVTAPAVERPLSMMLSLAERRVSGFNRNVLDAPPPERRTAKEIDFMDSARKRVLGVIGVLYQIGMKRNGWLIWEMFRQFGPRKFYTHVTGQPPIEMTQAQVQGEFNVVPVGAVADMDPGYRAQQKMMRLQVGMQMHPLLQDDPRFEHDLAQLYVDWQDEIDPVSAQRIIKRRSPQEMQAIVQQQQQLAARDAQLEDIAKRLYLNVPLSQDDAKALLYEIRKMGPHKDLQQVMAGARASRSAAQRGMGLVGQNGAG